MFLRRLTLQNFRNHTETDLTFKSKLIFFIGNNGEGKTNILESISILSLLKSFRESDEDQVLKWDSDFTFLRAEFESRGEDFLFEYGIQKQGIKRKRIKINGEVIKKVADSIGFFKSVILCPPDLAIIEAGNQERRKFIDSFISSHNQTYLQNIIEYQRLLKQRNSALKKENPSVQEIEIWNEPLVERDAQIRKERQKIISELSIYFSKNLSTLSNGKDNFDIFYKPNVSSEQEHREKLIKNLKKDMAIGYTSCGSHRDDIPIGTQERDLSHFGSQGQKRSAVIAMKTASFQWTKENTGEAPVLLIDDIIRELDVKRREYFVELISGCDQAFFTTTDLEGIKDYIGSLDFEREIYEIESGSVKRRIEL
ncbi:recombinational DNA repair ATPase [Leptospira ryugenii]|uniref:DNA replication and repair protein RecF n=1 Tax=Leptospira ryugenii TaxID=1917863 RepID=A0A2P2E360_9LEPT|nr:DNA replication/repair protein RecF [Leptospira ryugenii]GBF51332.1 recombinational DNA repair ATPase [Leptospira ryugenii]